MNLSTLHPDVVGFSAFRVFESKGEQIGRWYSAVRFRDGNKGANRALRMYQKVGWVPSEDAPHAAMPYAVLDALDEQGDILQDFQIVNAQAFQQIKRRLGLVVEPEDD